MLAIDADIRLALRLGSIAETQKVVSKFSIFRWVWNKALGVLECEQLFSSRLLHFVGISHLLSQSLPVPVPATLSHIHTIHWSLNRFNQHTILSSLPLPFRSSSSSFTSRSSISTSSSTSTTSWSATACTNAPCALSVSWKPLVLLANLCF